MDWSNYKTNIPYDFYKSTKFHEVYIDDFDNTKDIVVCCWNSKIIEDFCEMDYTIYLTNTGKWYDIYGESKYVKLIFDDNKNFSPDFIKSMIGFTNQKNNILPFNAYIENMKREKKKCCINNIREYVNDRYEKYIENKNKIKILEQQFKEFHISE